MMNGWNCFDVREICIVRRQSALRVTTFFRQTTKLHLCQNFKEYIVSAIYKIQWIQANRPFTN